MPGNIRLKHHTDVILLFSVNITRKYQPPRRNWAEKRAATRLKHSEKYKPLAEQYAAGVTIEELAKKSNIKRNYLRTLICREMGHEKYNAVKKQHSEAREKQLFQKCMDFIKQLGRLPYIDELRQHDKIASNHYFLNHWNKIAEQAGYKYIKKKNTPRSRYSNEWLIEHLKELGKSIGHTPSSKDIKKAAKVHATYYALRFGSISNAQRLAGFKPNNAGHQSKIKETNEELIAALKKLAEKLGRPPKVYEIKKHLNISYYVYKYRFGSFANALRTIGLKTRKLRGSNRTKK